MRKYDEEFKREAVRKIHDGQSVASVARELGCAESQLHRSQARYAGTEFKLRARGADFKEARPRTGDGARHFKKSRPQLGSERLARYRLIDEERVGYPVGLLCRVMQVSERAYHNHRSGKS